MAANGAARLQSVVQRPNQDGHTAFPSPTPRPRRGGSPTGSHPAVHMQDQPPFGLQRPDEVADNSTPSASWVSYLLQTVKAQTTWADKRGARGGRYTYGPFSRRIRDTPIPRRLENPLDGFLRWDIRSGRTHRKHRSCSHLSLCKGGG